MQPGAIAFFAEAGMKLSLFSLNRPVLFAEAITFGTYMYSSYSQVVWKKIAAFAMLAWVFPVLIASPQQVDSLVHATSLSSSDNERPLPPSPEEGMRTLQEYSSQIRSLNKLLTRGLDTLRMVEVLERNERVAKISEDVLGRQDAVYNLRLLGSVGNLIDASLRRMESLERDLNQRIDDLLGAKELVEGMKKSAVFHQSVEQEGLLADYVAMISSTNESLQYTDSLLNDQRLQAITFKSRLSSVQRRLIEIDQQVQYHSSVLKNNLLRKEVNYIWNRTEQERSGRFIQALHDAFVYNVLIGFRYARENVVTFIFLLVLIGLCQWWFRKNLNQVRRRKDFASVILSRILYLQYFPLLAAILVVITVGPLLFPDPPVSFFAVFLFAQVTISGVLFSKRVNAKVMRLWLLFFVLFVVSLVSNLFWETVYEERDVHFIMSLAGMGIVLLLIKELRKGKNGLPKYLPAMASGYVGLEFTSAVANIFGRTSLAKMLGLSATVGLMMAFALIAFVFVIKEAIYIQIEVSRGKDNDFTSSLDFNQIRNRIIKWASFLAIFIWTFYFLENLSLLDVVTRALGDFLSTPRSIVNATFTFESVVVFIAVVYISTILANNIAYFAEVKDRQYAGQRSKRLGSQVLLIKLALYSIGFLIAIAVSGIPLDKIAIVLGALSVGIGFGLQTIVNNLVSGIILAFEKPIQIGDVVSVGTMEGIVQDIGIRASKIKNWDGGEVIIPNGDLLAQHLINWTLSDKQRRVELMLEVSYRSDVDEVTKVIISQLAMNGILTTPEPTAYLQTVKEHVMVFRVLFWVADFETWIVLRDQVMRAIYSAFRENGIEVPFQQRDLHIRTFPDPVSESVKSAKDLTSRSPGKESKP